MRTLHKTLLATTLTAMVVVPFLDLDADASAPGQPDTPPGGGQRCRSGKDRTRTAPLGARQRDQSPGCARGERAGRSRDPGGRSRAAGTAGQALAVLDDTALRLREQEAQADLARIQAQLDLATRQEQRYAQLAAQQNIARAQYEQLRADRDMLVQDRARAQALLAQTRHQRTQMMVRAPFAGVVAESEVRAGRVPDHRRRGCACRRHCSTGSSRACSGRPGQAPGSRHARAGARRRRRACASGERAGAGRRRSLAPARTAHRDGRQRIARSAAPSTWACRARPSCRRRGAARRRGPASRRRLRPARRLPKARPSGWPLKTGPEVGDLVEVTGDVSPAIA